MIKGSGLGPASPSVATSFPLSTAIGGTSIRITIGGRPVDAIMYYALEGQAAAILPSPTPIGIGTIVLTYGGQTSQPFSITVVDRNFAIFTTDSSGAGLAIATANSGFVSPTAVAHTGDVIALWGTGLGAVAGDETRPADQSDLTIPNLEVWVGGKKSEVQFRGRSSCCTSVDTVFVTIPAGVPSCITPVTVRDWQSCEQHCNVASCGLRHCLQASGRQRPRDQPATLGRQFHF